MVRVLPLHLYVQCRLLTGAILFLQARTLDGEGLRFLVIEGDSIQLTASLITSCLTVIIPFDVMAEK